MKNNIAALIVGFIFALGLGISGMTRPEKVIGFLNIFGNWDASLAFVMAGAIAVHSLAYRLIRRRNSPLFSKQFYLPIPNRNAPTMSDGVNSFEVGK